MKATLTLEIEGSKEEIDSITNKIQKAVIAKKPKVKMRPLAFQGWNKPMNPPRRFKF